jgi:hypothetical protein
MANSNISTVNYSLKKVVANIIDFANDHGTIKSFGLGDVNQIGATTIKQYPLLWIDYLPITMGENFMVYAFQAISADLIEPSESDLLDRRADTTQILWDLKQALVYTYDLDVNFNSVLTPFQDSKADKITGYYMNLEVRIPILYDVCDIPTKLNSTIYLVDSDSSFLVDFDNSNLVTV